MHLAALPTGAEQVQSEHRAFWCHSAFGVSGMTWDQAIKNLADNGFTAILPNMCWGGAAFYESRVLPVHPSVETRGDQIAECLAACRKHGIACHVWKVNYYMRYTSRDFIERMRREGRTQVHLDGRFKNWLCPSHPENRRLEVSAMVEIATKYDVDGIHFDYIRYPDSLHCFCDGCRERFERTIGRCVKGWPRAMRRGGKSSSRAWLRFRRQQITAVVAEVARQVRKVRPKVKISAAVWYDIPTHRDIIGQEWQMWCERGYLDFVCPMDYWLDPQRFEELMAKQVKWAGGVPCYPGLGLSVWRPKHDFDKLVRQIEVTGQLKTGGFTIFNYGMAEANRIVPRLGKLFAKQATP